MTRTEMDGAYIHNIQDLFVVGVFFFRLETDGNLAFNFQIVTLLEGAATSWSDR